MLDRKKCLTATYATPYPLRDKDVYEARLHGSLESYVAHRLKELLIAHQTREKGDR
jgi:hypothetical protein